jgi:tRNA pseudouridine(55) synthase
MYIIEKQSGVTINSFIENLKKEKKICYCGRLDPMARGKILILEGDECKQMDYFNKKSKEYEFKIILGIQTDTDDPLGIIENYDFNLIFNDNLVMESFYDIILELNNYPKTFQQKYHKYSSKKINGKSLFWYSKNNIPVDIPSKEVNIYNLLINKIDKINLNDWIKDINAKIDNIDINTDFRQNEIIKQWKNINLENNSIKLHFLDVKMQVSSGFYIRQFVRDISTNVITPLMVYDINRTSIIM